MNSYTGIYILAFRRQFALKLMFSYHTGYLKLSEFWYLENPGNTCTLYLILHMKDKQSMNIFFKPFFSELQFMIIPVNQGFYDFSITGTMYNTGTFIFTLFHKEHSSLHRFVELSKTMIKILLCFILHKLMKKFTVFAECVIHHILADSHSVYLLYVNHKKLLNRRF